MLEIEGIKYFKHPKFLIGKLEIFNWFKLGESKILMCLKIRTLKIRSDKL